MTANTDTNIGDPAKAVSPKKFVWYDVMTSDVAAATDFYRSVVGWSAADSGSERTYSSPLGRSGYGRRDHADP
jgi:predicted enzyme related to lactoylglutathione lyase